MEDEKKFDINALAIQYGADYKIKRIRDETDDNYRSRVSGILRGRGNLVEAHEVFSGRRHDDPEQGDLGPITGLFGALAQVLEGKDYSPNDPERQIGDDLAVGIVTRFKDRSAETALATIFGALGPSAGMDFIEATREKRKRK